MQAASVAGRSAVRGRKAKRVQMLGGRPFRLPSRCATCAGYSVHAGTAVGARDRGGLERLCRYVARPAVSSRRVTEIEDGRVRLELKRPWSDGTVALTFTAEEPETDALSASPNRGRTRYRTWA